MRVGQRGSEAYTQQFADRKGQNPFLSGGGKGKQSRMQQKRGSPFPCKATKIRGKAFVRKTKKAGERKPA